MENEVEEKKEDDVYEAIEHPAQDPPEEPETPSEIAKEFKEEFEEWTMDKPTRIALITGLVSTVITVLNVLFG